MHPPHEPASDALQPMGRFESDPLGISPEILVSLATGPLLLALSASKTLGQLVQEIGQQSEELFRGDRLPLLDFPSPPKPDRL